LRAPGIRERLARDFALDQRDIERARPQQRDVLGAALRVPRLDQERCIGLAHGLDQSRAIKRKPAAQRRGTEREPGVRRSRRMLHHVNVAPRLLDLGRGENSRNRRRTLASAGISS
jgi:hypothetical protein